MKNLVKIIICSLIIIAVFFLKNFVYKHSSKTEIKQLDEIERSVRFKKARVALVLDDWGYNLENLEMLRKIKQPVTLSVLPNLPYSQTIAEFSRGKNIEIILHLPLESYNHSHMENDTICCNMKEDEIAEIFNEALVSVPYSRGISNHMGSRATEDKNVMSVIFGQMKKKEFFFLDSVVTKKTICRGLARKIGLKFAKRDVFLDNEDDKFYIKSQMEKLAELAKINGQAVGIGHDRQLTLEVICEEMENLEKRGITFVFLSQLVN